jgi:hypothetical protein
MQIYSDSEGEEDYHHGDASSYEQYLDYILKTKKNLPPAPLLLDQGYMSDPAP